MDDGNTTVEIRHRVKGIDGNITPRQLRDFINQMPEAALDRSMLLFVDGGCAEAMDADFRNGVLNLF